MELRAHSRRFARYVDTISLPPEALATMSRADILRKVRSAFDGRERFYEDVSPEVLRRIAWRPEVRRLAWTCSAPGCGKVLLAPGASRYCEEHGKEARQENFVKMLRSQDTKRVDVAASMAQQLGPPPPRILRTDAEDRVACTECGGRVILDAHRWEASCTVCGLVQR